MSVVHEKAGPPYSGREPFTAQASRTLADVTHTMLEPGIKEKSKMALYVSAGVVGTAAILAGVYASNREAFAPNSTDANPQGGDTPDTTESINPDSVNPRSGGVGIGNSATSEPTADELVASVTFTPPEPTATNTPDDRYPIK